MELNRNVARAGMVAILMTGLTACQGTNEEMGVVLGGVVGGVVGNQFGGGDGKIAATAIGAMIGAAAGGAVGASLDHTSRQQVANAAVIAFENGTGASWSNPQNSSGPAQGTVTVLNSDRACREYVHEVTIGGRKEQAYGTACRDSNGDWQIVG